MKTESYTPNTFPGVSGYLASKNTEKQRGALGDETSHTCFLRPCEEAQILISVVIVP